LNNSAAAETIFANSAIFCSILRQRCAMFMVIFEVCPKDGQWDAYLNLAKGLKPELEQIDGFVDNIRYASLTRKGWLLSLSGWRDEKALVRWRTRPKHHAVQAKSRERIFADYHLRIGEITRATGAPALTEQRLDETQVGDGTAVTLIDAPRPKEWQETKSADDCAAFLGLNRNTPGLVAWDVFEAVLTPGDLILLQSWKTAADARNFENSTKLPAGARLRRVRVVRDYGMFDRREAPQCFPDAEGKEAVHG
jgi:heme-degrading monooxygenase HmoA